MIDGAMHQTEATLAFAPPGPGHWELETAHHGLRPVSWFLRDVYRRTFQTGIVEPLERYGLPVATVQAEYVHGCLYMRPLGIGEKPDAPPKAPPPTWLMKIVARFHPELRRRARAADAAFTGRTWRAEVDRWFDHDRDEQLLANLAIQAVDPSRLDDGQLADHISHVLAHFEQSARRNLATHGGDLVPTGDLLAHGEDWGIDAADMMALLAGSSPAAIETALMLQPAARAIRRSGTPRASLRSVDDVRGIGVDAADAVDEWLRLYGWRCVSTDDIDRPTLAEVPTLQLAALLAATEEVVVATPDDAAVRERVPAEHRGLFDEILAEARYGHRQRDDIRGLCWNWPVGLVRRAVLEAGRRLHATGRLLAVDHVVDLRPGELDRLVRDGPSAPAPGPAPDAIADRAAERDRVEAAPPPRTLGQPEPAPPFDALPRGMARAARALMANLAADATPTPRGDDAPGAHGVGIGSESYRGRACVVRDLMLAFDELRPGDVLVTPFTGPSVNSLLPIVGALVVEEGGAVCHAAIVAREFGLPAVIGAHAATSRLVHGAMVEVDPVRGTVRPV